MSIYQNLYDLIVNYIYGNVPLTSDMELVTVTLATIGCVFVVSIPFIVVWQFIKIITR